MRTQAKNLRAMSTQPQAGSEVKTIDPSTVDSSETPEE